MTRSPSNGGEAPVTLSEVLRTEYAALHSREKTQELDQELERPEEDQGKERPPSEIERRRRFWAHIHKGGDRSALCLSGGGIRSATFNLGVLQALAERKLLDHFEFLSTVSGGGYIGGWLSAWIHRHRDGVGGVMRALGTRPKDSKGGQVEPDEIQWLREYSNYLSPRAGIFSLDTWMIVATYLRNLVVNWLVLVPLLFGILLTPRLVVAWFRTPPGSSHFGIWLAGLALLSVVVIAVGLWSVGKNLPSVVAPRLSTLAMVEEYSRNFPRVRRLLLTCLVIGTTALVLEFGLLESQSGYTPRFYLEHPALALTLLGVVLYGFPGLLTIWRRVRRQPSADPREELQQRLRETQAVFPWIKVTAAGSDAAARAGLRRIEWLRALINLAAMAGAGALGGGALALVRSGLVGDYGHGSAYRAELFTVLTVPLVLLSVLLAGAAYVGWVASAELMTDDDMEWTARIGAWGFLFGLGWMVMTGLVLFGPVLFAYAPRAVSAAGGITGLIAVLLGRSASTSAAKGGAGERKGQGARFSLRQLAPALAAPVFICVMVMGISAITSSALERLTCQAVSCPIPDESFVDYSRNPPSTRPPDRVWLSANLAPLDTVIASYTATPDSLWPSPYPGLPHGAARYLALVWYGRPVPLLALVILSLLVSYGLSRVTNLNKFSLHAMYRSRLIRAYLGASNRDRRAYPATGFDPGDNLPMGQLWAIGVDDADIRDPEAILALLRDEKARAAVPAVGLCAAMVQEVQARETCTEREALPKMLNQLIDGASLAGRPEFADVKRSAATRRVLAGVRDAPEGSPALRLANRLLLEDAFAQAGYPIERRRATRPMPIVNIALNLVSGKRLAWQERKASSFTVTPLFAGTWNLPTTGDPVPGYRPTDYPSANLALRYGGEKGISLGTAITISGAAASPNMGYHSSPMVTLLMTLFNARLGWWLGNPGAAGKETWMRWAPRSSVGPVLQEALGLTDSRQPYVYLSDGGHFENLGLYEMVLRRCKYVVVCDASADPNGQYEDLGNAIRKVRIDLGIRITLEGELPHPRGQKDRLDKPVPICTLGRIHYADVDRVPEKKNPGDLDGYLLYIKPTLVWAEPRDVQSYAERNPAFPHESTGDQFFSESQFESYRALGRDLVDRLAPGGGETQWSLKTLFEVAGKNRRFSPQGAPAQP